MQLNGCQRQHLIVIPGGQCKDSTCVIREHKFRADPSGTNEFYHECADNMEITHEYVYSPRLSTVQKWGESFFATLARPPSDPS